MYKIPENYYYRIHHVRPRFKGDVENVLIYMAESLCRIGELPNDEFRGLFNSEISLFPGNADKAAKTINNWRTEISSLFGFVVSDEKTSKPSRRAVELAEKGDLVEFFKKFLFTFQYPGAHIKTHEISALIEKNIKFKPANYLIQLLNYAENSSGKRSYITKGEFCHCVYNDIRATSKIESHEQVWQRIVENRAKEYKYDLRGDVTRYAGDIIDYMEIANLLVSYDGFHYYLNSLETETLLVFANSQEWFDGYDELYTKGTIEYSDINEQQVAWFDYVNRDLDETDFSTDILSFIAKDQDEYEKLVMSSNALIDSRLEDVSALRTKDIGDMGEGMVYAHEKQRVKIGGRSDLLHLIQRIPTQFAVGYDISSIEIDERRRYIEVKTTVSSKPLHFNRIHLTSNEWRTADSVKDRYFIYRLMISKSEKKLFIIQDPVGLYKNNLIEMLPKDGADISFSTETAGEFQELLTWEE